MNGNNQSIDEQVQKFLEEIQILDDEKYHILQGLRKVVFGIFNIAVERMMYGGIMFSLEEDFGGIFVRKNHISVEFVNGYLMTDPKKMLEGTGKFRRHLKIRSLSDIEDKETEFFVKQADLKS